MERDRMIRTQRERGKLEDVSSSFQTSRENVNKIRRCDYKIASKVPYTYHMYMAP